ncbi:MAG: hypothetical protein ACR9NN_16495 [Nostochopsis sp.]
MQENFFVVSALALAMNHQQLVSNIFYQEILVMAQRTTQRLYLLVLALIFGFLSIPYFVYFKDIF